MEHAQPTKMEHVKPMLMILVNRGKIRVVKLIEILAVVSGKIQPVKAIKTKVPISVQYFIKIAIMGGHNGNSAQVNPYRADGEIRRALSRYLLVENLKFAKIRMKEVRVGPLRVVIPGLETIATIKYPTLALRLMDFQ